MSCGKCSKATSDEVKSVYYYRIGTKQLGWGNIGILACYDHAKLAIDRLNTMVEIIEKAESAIKGGEYECKSCGSVIYTPKGCMLHQKNIHRNEIPETDIPNWYNEIKEPSDLDKELT